MRAHNEQSEKYGEMHRGATTAGNAAAVRMDG